jgi:hypothetical protein
MVHWALPALVTVQVPPTTLKVVKPRYCALEPIELRSNVPDPVPPSCRMFLPEGSTMPPITYPAPSVSVLPLPANWIAVPPVPTIAPASKMLTGRAVLISMPAEPEITPKLVMPPVKVGPAMAIAVLLARISLALSIRMPWLVALIVPLSTIAPVMVLPFRPMPVLAVIVPPLAMLPVKVGTPFTKPSEVAPIAIPRRAALIVPPLVTPPAKVETSKSEMPVFARIVPLFTMPPPATGLPNTEPVKTPMPLNFPAEIKPLLLIAPAKVSKEKPTKIPLRAPRIVPLLVMPPEKMEKLTTPMPDVLLLITPPAALKMPPEKSCTLATKTAPTLPGTPPPEI